MTPLSATTAFVSAADSLNFIDARIIGDAVNDAGVRVSAAGLATNPTWQALLDAAAGEILEFAQAGERYQPADLVALAAPQGPGLPPLVGGRKLQALNTGVATRMALERRNPLEVMPQLVKNTQEQMERLRKGEWIFGFVETAAAGLPGRIDDTASTTKPQLSCTDRRYFGLRQKYKTNWGGCGGCWGGCG